MDDYEEEPYYEVKISARCSVCNEEVTDAEVFYHRAKPEAVWICSKGHATTMRWML